LDNENSAVTKKDLAEVLSLLRTLVDRADRVDTRLGAIEHRLETVEHRLETVEHRVDELKTYVDERAKRVETKLLTAFQGSVRSMEIRLRYSASNVASLDERLALLEERVVQLELRKAS
jgi:chromosome segregation ATPase